MIKIAQYPLLLKPIVKDYIWGGNHLKNEFGIKSDKEIVAEAWMLASHKDGTNVVLNGEYAGMSLYEVLEKWGYQDELPILIKLIDA